jgi:hypothetical protein
LRREYGTFSNFVGDSNGSHPRRSPGAADFDHDFRTTERSHRRSCPRSANHSDGTSTGAVTRAVSDAAGFYLLPNIPPGTYDLRTEKTGFQSYIQKGAVVEVDRPVTLNIALSMGNATQSVTVTAAPPQVDTRSATLNYEITTRMATDLPLNGRNVLQLATLAPDVSPGPSSGLQQKASRPEDANLYTSADGGRGESTSFYLDSGINEDALSLNANIFPNPDAIQEFSVETNSYSAKFGGRGARWLMRSRREAQTPSTAMPLNSCGITE